MEHAVNRRRFVLGSGAALALSGVPSATVGQQSGAIRVPVVDSLSVRIVTDSSYDTPRIRQHKLVKVRRQAFTTAPKIKTLHSEWGLSAMLDSRIGAESRTTMLDFGYTPEALLNNLEFMSIDVSKVGALVMSHGHFDHFGGLIGFLKQYRSRLPADLTLYAGGEENFCVRKTGTGVPGHFADWGVLDRRELAALNVKVVYCDKPTVIQGHAFTSGHIRAWSTESIFPSTQVSYRKRPDGVGCDLPEEDAKWKGEFAKQDNHLHEHATCFHVKDRGLVVISSCGHRGIVNSVREAIAASGVSKVHAVMGGFHLFPAEDGYIRKVVKELEATSPDVIIPLHCSGPDMVNIVREVSPEKLLTSTTGTEFTFGA
jgi:7,8-dihydropterin-6-yl-methyl-4-(beta-D-ribofuranosyl)aminobenzene 5'-phosphate synthase